MNMRMLTLAVLAAFSGAASAASTGQVAVASPDGRAVIKIARDGGSYAVTRGGETVIATSPLGLEFDGQPAFGALVLEKVTRTSADRAIPLVATKASSARDHYRAATLSSGYVYQIYAYLMSQAGTEGDRPSEGLMLHPVVDGRFDEEVVIQGRRIRFATVDLTTPGWKIADDFLAAVSPRTATDALTIG